MSYEIAGSQVTDAIRKLTQSMGVDLGSLPAGPTQPEQTARNGGGIAVLHAPPPPEAKNATLESKLIDYGVFTEPLAVQRQVLGCVGCKLAAMPGTIGRMTAQQIEKCTGNDRAAVCGVLDNLVNIGLMDSNKRQSTIPGVTPQDIFSLAPAALRTSFKNALETPNECSLDKNPADSTGGAAREKGPATAAIEDAAKTVHSEKKKAPHTPVADDILCNRDAEEALIKAGRLTKSGQIQRQILGCIACKLGSGDGSEGVSAHNFIQCSDGSPRGVRIALQRMLENGILLCVERPESTMPSNYDSYVLGPASNDLSLTRLLEKPPQCRQEAPLAKSDSTEDMLVEKGVVTNRTPARRATLACLGCKLHAGEDGVYAGGVNKCKGIGDDSALSVLSALAAKGVLQASREETGRGPGGSGMPRVIYAPTDTPLGRQLREALQSEAPENCGLEETRVKNNDS